MYCSRQIVSWTADSSNKSDILPSVTLGTRHHVCVQLSRKYRRCIRTSGVSRISRSSNQPHAIWQLTRGQNPRAAARCRHKHNYPLGLTPLTPLLAANLAISPLSAVVCTVLYCTVLHTALHCICSCLEKTRTIWQQAGCWLLVKVHGKSVGVLAVAGTLRHVLARCHTSRHWVVQSGVDRRLSFCCLRVSRVSI